VNPAAGGGRAGALLPQIERELAARGVSCRVAATEGLEHAGELAAEAVRDGEVAVSVGGDGIAGAVAAGIARAGGGVLGLIPAGRGNDLVRTLAIPRDVPGACAVVAEGVEREMDLGEAGVRMFAGIASAGFDSDANRIANEAPAWLGGLVYAYGALRALARWRPARFTVRLDGEELSFRGYSVAAANARAYGGGMYLAPAAEIDDGLLDVVLIEDSSRLRFLAGLPSVFRGTHVRRPSVRVLRAREVEFLADRTFVLYADGDPVAPLPVVVRAVPRALRVLVPR
jgi:YegS/Rv2252/BmrU family lipid kinase